MGIIERRFAISCISSNRCLRMYVHGVREPAQSVANCRVGGFWCLRCGGAGADDLTA